MHDPTGTLVYTILGSVNLAAVIVKDILFEAAHSLPHTPPSHRCRRIHGHSYKCELHVTGPLDPQKGWVVDFAEIDQHCAPLLAQLDHHYLNEVAGLENPTAENICIWIWERLKTHLPGLIAVVIHETIDSRCVYTGPGV